MIKRQGLLWNVSQPPLRPSIMNQEIFVFMNEFMNVFVNEFMNVFVNEFMNVFVNEFMNVFVNEFMNVFMNEFMNDCVTFLHKCSTFNCIITSYFLASQLHSLKDTRNHGS